jgi:hypothetical protein
MDQTLYEYITESSIGASPYIAAKIAEFIFKKQYVVHKVGRNNEWFEKNADGTLNRIDDVIIRRRLSSDVAIIVSQARERFKNDPEYNKIGAFISNNKSLDALNLTLKQLAEKRSILTATNRIDEAKVINNQIIDTESAIEFLTHKQNLQRTDMKDIVFSGLTQLENKLYNYSFKNQVIKELEDIYYQPYN